MSNPCGSKLGNVTSNGPRKVGLARTPGAASTACRHGAFEKVSYLCERSDGCAQGEGGDYWNANTQVGLVMWLMPDLEVMASRFRGVPFFTSLDLLQVCWQMLLAEETQKKLFSTVLPSGLFTATAVPQGMLKSTTLCLLTGRNLAGNLPAEVYGLSP